VKVQSIQQLANRLKLQTTMNVLIPSTHIKTVHTKVTQFSGCWYTFPALAPSLTSCVNSSLVTVNHYPSYYTWLIHFILTVNTSSVCFAICH